MQNRFVRLVPILVLATIVALLISAPVHAVAPVVIPGNPTCPAGTIEFKLDNSELAQGEHQYTDGVLELTITRNGESINWTANIGVDVVIMKGGPNGNFYDYRPDESSGDTLLVSPTNPNNGQPFGISHISFCYDLEPRVSKTVNTSWERTYTWTFDKKLSDTAFPNNAEPDDALEYVGVPGNLFNWDYWLSLNVAIHDVVTVNGVITVTNPTLVSVTFNQPTDVLSNGTSVTVSGCSVAFPAVIAAGGSFTCNYNATLHDGGAFTPPVGLTNTASVTTTTGVVGTFSSPAVPVTFAANPTLTPDSHPATVNVEDINDNGTGLPLEDDGTFTQNGIGASGDIDYSPTGTGTNYTSYTCPTDSSKYTNGIHTITINNTARVTNIPGLEDSAVVTVTCYAPLVSKIATPSWQQDFQWDIFKNVDKTTFTGSPGDGWTFNYDIDVDLTSYDELNFAVSGTITVQNPAPPASGLSMNVNVADAVTGVGAATVDCDAIAAGNQTSLIVAAGSSGQCSYSLDMGDLLDGGQNTVYTNVATASIGGGNFTGDKTFMFGDVLPTLAAGSEPAEVTATDDDATPLDPIDDHHSVTITETTENVITYPQTGECPTDILEYTEGVYTVTLTNTAVIDQTDDEDSETVTVTCYAPVVWKDATATFDRDWTWNIVKTGPLGPIVLQDSQSYMVDYQVQVTATYEDTESVVGTIYVSNPGGEAMVVSLADTLDDGTIADITGCNPGSWNDATQEVTVAAGETAECAYVASPANRSNDKNTVSYSFGELSSTFTAGYTYTLDVETDECVVVDDTLKGNLGSICVSVVGGVITYDGTPVAGVLYNATTSTFSYQLDLEPLVSELECGEHTIYNVASFETNDTHTKDSDDHSVVVDKPCEGCTLTLGYWKTHSDQGPAPYDAEGWGALGDADGDGIEEEEGELFFLSGQTYLQVLRTAPAGNVYYILARQYIAAELNILNDADDSSVESAMTAAYNLLSTKSPAQAASLKGGAKKAWTDAASTLDKFNNGIIGPGHCDEDDNSVN